MADDEKAPKDGQVPADPPGVEPSNETFKQATAHYKTGNEPASEWTASDLRGPLSTAEAEEAARRSAAGLAPASGTPPEPEDPHSEKAIADTPHELTESVEPKADPEAAAPQISPRPAEETDRVPPRPAHLVQEVKRPILPIAAGIVIGAAIGAGSAAFVYRSVQNDVVSDEVVRLTSRVDALEKRPGSEASVASLKQNVADLEGKVAALGKGGAATPDIGPLQARVAALQAGLDALKARSADAGGVDAKVAKLETAVAGMKNQASSAEAGVAAMQGQQKQLAGKVMMPALAVVADSLVQQIDQGQPYAAQVDALDGLGADPAKIAVLRKNAVTGVPSAKMLAAKFEPLAEPLTTTAHHAPANAGFVERLKSGMMGLVSVRRADDLSGNDPASRVALIKADLAHDDVTAALVAWEGLPAEAKTKGEAWRALAKTHADAMAVARSLQQAAIAALGGKKS